MGKRAGVVLGLILLLACELRAEVCISHITAATGPYWPSKKELVYYPGDLVSFRYLVSGLQTDKNQAIDTTVTCAVFESNGKLIISQSQPWNYHAVLGDGAGPHMTGFEVNDRFKPGDYTVKVTVRDNLADREASFERHLTVRPEEWAISAVAFYRDSEGRQPGCLDAHLGEQLYYKMKIIGYDKQRIDCEMRMELLDAKGDDVLSKPFTQVFVNNNGELIRSVPYLRAEGALPTFTRPGKYTLKITVVDHVHEKIAVYQAPLKITPVP